MSVLLLLLVTMPTLDRFYFVFFFACRSFVVVVLCGKGNVWGQKRNVELSGASLQRNPRTVSTQ